MLTKKRFIVALSFALFLVVGLVMPAFDADAGPCSRSQAFCDRY